MSQACSAVSVAIICRFQWPARSPMPTAKSKFVLMIFAAAGSRGKFWTSMQKSSSATAQPQTFHSRTGLKIETQLELLQEELGYQFKNPALLSRSLTHVSYDRQKSESHNEVLEFLGDAVLDLAI